MAYNQRINFPVLITLGLSGALLLVVFITGTQAWFAYEENRVTNVQIARSGQSDLVVQRDRQLRHLQNLHWADQARTRIAIPIEQAMQILADNHGVMPSTQPAPKAN